MSTVIFILKPRTGVGAMLSVKAGVLNNILVHMNIRFGLNIKMTLIDLPKHLNDQCMEQMMPEEFKQMIVMRKDLNMRKGKMIAQGAHASMKALLENMDHPSVKAWLSQAFAKIAVSVDSEEELLAVMEKARSAGLITALITDAGRTEFNGVPTNTCIAIGPASNDELLPITGHLKLL